jgi:hypothetical protein
MMSLEDCVRAAHDAIDGRHHFRVAEMPMNLVEHFPATVLNQDGGRCTTLERAMELGIDVVINRPLNAIVDNDLIRLVSHTMPAHIIHPSDIERRIHELEVVEHDLANALLAEAAPSQGPDERMRELVSEAYRVAGSLCQAWSTFQGLIHWRDVRRQFIDPRLEAAAMLSEKSARMCDHLAYISDVVRVLDDLRSRHAMKTTHLRIFGSPCRRSSLWTLRCPFSTSRSMHYGALRECRPSWWACGHLITSRTCCAWRSWSLPPTTAHTGCV